MTLGRGVNVIERFLSDLRTLVQSQSVCQTRLKQLAKDKHSSVLQKSVMYGQKSFITLGPGVNVIEHFLCDLWIFIQSKSVCQTRLEQLAKDKYSSLLQKSVIYGQKSFITLGPGVNVIEFFHRELQIFEQSQCVCVRRGWKSLPRTSTLAYYKNLSFTDKKV